MKEGVLVDYVHRRGKPSCMRMTGYILQRMENMFPGQLLSPDISAFHQVYDWDEQYLQIRSSPRSFSTVSDTAPLSGEQTIPV